MSMKLNLAGIALGATVSLLSAQQSSAASVAPGFNLFTTVSAILTQGALVISDFEGNPASLSGGLCGANQFNFGGGCTNTGQTDTVVQRIDEATDLDGDIDIEIVGLSLVSAGLHNVFGGPEQIGARMLKDLTTDTWLHGMDVGSTASIGFGPDLWSSTLRMNVEIYGLTSGLSTIVYKELTLTNAPWTRDPLEATILIPGINYVLNGTDTSGDFWSDAVAHDDGGGTVHTIDPPPVPVPASLPLLAGALVALGGLLRRARA